MQHQEDLTMPAPRLGRYIFFGGICFLAMGMHVLNLGSAQAQRNKTHVGGASLDRFQIAMHTRLRTGALWRSGNLHQSSPSPRLRLAALWDAEIWGKKGRWLLGAGGASALNRSDAVAAVSVARIKNDAFYCRRFRAAMGGPGGRCLGGLLQGYRWNHTRWPERLFVALVHRKKSNKSNKSTPRWPRLRQMGSRFVVGRYRIAFGEGLVVGGRAQPHRFAGDLGVGKLRPASLAGLWQQRPQGVRSPGLWGAAAAFETQASQRVVLSWLGFMSTRIHSLASGSLWYPISSPKDGSMLRCGGSDSCGPHARCGAEGVCESQEVLASHQEENSQPSRHPWQGGLRLMAVGTRIRGLVLHAKQSSNHSQKNKGGLMIGLGGYAARWSLSSNAPEGSYLGVGSLLPRKNNFGVWGLDLSFRHGAAQDQGGLWIWASETALSHQGAMASIFRVAWRKRLKQNFSRKYLSKGHSAETRLALSAQISDRTFINPWAASLGGRRFCGHSERNQRALRLNASHRFSPQLRLWSRVQVLGIPASDSGKIDGCSLADNASEDVVALRWRAALKAELRGVWMWQLRRRVRAHGGDKGVWSLLWRYRYSSVGTQLWQDGDAVALLGQGSHFGRVGLLWQKSMLQIAVAGSMRWQYLLGQDQWNSFPRVEIRAWRRFRLARGSFMTLGFASDMRWSKNASKRKRLQGRSRGFGRLRLPFGMQVHLDYGLAWQADEAALAWPNHAIRAASEASSWGDGAENPSRIIDSGDVHARLGDTGGDRPYEAAPPGFLSRFEHRIQLSLAWHTSSSGT